MQNYLSFFHFGKDGKFDVTFPQFPGCVSQGDDFADAQRMATEALALHVDGMREDDEEIPLPIETMTQTLLSKFYEASHDRGSFLPVPIPLLPPPGKSVRIQVTIDSRLLSRIDAVTKNRSGFLADAATDRLGNRD
jgi:predicted RNase H-like HicB family nuclease